MQLGLTWPLQRLLHTSVPYGMPVARGFCWDAHCIRYIVLINKFSRKHIDLTHLHIFRAPVDQQSGKGFAG